MLFLTIINVLQSYKIVQFFNFINYKFTKFTMFTSLYVCKIVNHMQIKIFNIAYNYIVTKFTNLQCKMC